MDLQAKDSPKNAAIPGQPSSKLADAPSIPPPVKKKSESQPQSTAGGDQGAPEKKKKKKKDFKGRKKGKPGKIHIRLPGPEAYRKEICFPAEAPGRVVVRLERLMGSDKIRPVDGKYMETLIQRLEEEEKLAWDRKIRLRKKAETERHRQLAINGLMEPGPGMEDLYNHPVFRVNRIFNRLSQIEHTFFDHRSLKMPPIEQIDPFESDDSGAFFKEYPFHRQLKENWQKYKHSGTSAASRGELDDEEQEEEEEEEVAEAGKTKSTMTLSKEASKAASKEASKAASKAASRAATTTQSETEHDLEEEEGNKEEEEDEFDEELDLGQKTSDEGFVLETDEEEEDEEMTERERLRMALAKESLGTLQDKYGCPKTPNFEEMWQPYLDELVDRFNKDFNSLDEIYEAGRDLFELFIRQDIVTREHLRTGHQPFVYPGETKSNLDIDDEEDEEGDEEGEEGDEEEGEDNEGEGESGGKEGDTQVDPTDSVPKLNPSEGPSSAPSAKPSTAPSAAPSTKPSAAPSAAPSTKPSAAPSAAPSTTPSAKPSTTPSAKPSTTPSAKPSTTPSAKPSTTPSAKPSTTPSAAPSTTPSAAPSASPSAGPNAAPSANPSTAPSAKPSTTPSAKPSTAPSAKPSQTGTAASSKATLGPSGGET